MTKSKTHQPGPVPASCCNRQITHEQVANRRSKGNDYIACPVCGKSWLLNVAAPAGVHGGPKAPVKRHAGIHKTPLQALIDAANTTAARPGRKDPTVVDQINENTRASAKKSGADVLGWTVWWSMEGVEVDQEDFALLVGGLGLDADLISERKKGGALSQALQALKSGYMVARCSDECNDQQIVYSLTEKRSDANLQRTDVQKVTYDRGTKSLSNFATDYRVRDIKELFAKFNVTLRTLQVSAYVRACLAQTKATRLRDSGGVYFVPASARSTKEKLARLLEKLSTSGQRSRLTAIDVLDTPTSGNQIREDVADGLVAELATMSAKLDREVFDPVEEKGRKVGPETIEARLSEFKALRAKAQSYRDLMQVNVVDVEAGVGALEDKIRTLVERV